MTNAEKIGSLSPGKGIFGGIKGAVGVFFALPFIILLVPLWYIFRWSEIRSGRPAPTPPWAMIWPGFQKETVGDPRTKPRQPEAAVPTHGEEPKSALFAEKFQAENLHGVAVVTGGATRLGAAICRDLAKLGFSVAVVYHRSKKQAEQLASEICASGSQADCFSLDLQNPAKIGTLFNAVERKLGPPTVLINNAAVFLPTSLEGGTWEVLDQVLAINLRGPLWLTLDAAAKMKERGGVIINIGDIWGEQPLPGYAAYSAAKAGLLMATRALARETAPQVRVNAIAPGAVMVPEERELEAAYRKILSRTPLARHAGPEAVVKAVRYLLTAPYVTGEILHVDGGRRLT